MTIRKKFSIDIFECKDEVSTMFIKKVIHSKYTFNITTSKKLYRSPGPYDKYTIYTDSEYNYYKFMVHNNVYIK